MSARVRWALVVLAMAACMGLLTGCTEAERITACAGACEKSGRAMLRYSNTEGCICTEPAKRPE